MEQRAIKFKKSGHVVIYKYLNQHSDIVNSKRDGHFVDIKEQQQNPNDIIMYFNQWKT